MIVPKKFDSGKVLTLPLGASAVCTKHGMMKITAGYLVTAATDDNEAEFVGLETVTDATATAGGTLVDVLPIDDTMVFHVTLSTTGADTTPVQATHVGNDYGVYVDGATTNIDITYAADKLFHVDKIVDAGSYIVEGRFNKPAVA